jgi:hypothetical protein
MSNTFTDRHPSFPYRSSEAEKHLGLPKSPEIHLAVTELAQELLRIAERSEAPVEHHRVQALRAASGAVLFGWPMPTAERELRFALEMSPNDAPPARYRIHEGMDWLALAAERLAEEGVEVQPDYQRQRSDYGWRRLGAD